MDYLNMEFDGQPLSAIEPLPVVGEEGVGLGKFIILKHNSLHLSARSLLFFGSELLRRIAVRVSLEGQILLQLLLVEVSFS